MDNHPSVLILSRSTQLRSSLEVLIASSPRVKSIRIEGDLKAVSELGFNYMPALVVLAFETADEPIRTTLEQIKATWPNTPTVVLVDNERQLPAAISAGAEAAAVKGILAANLLKVIEGLLEDGA